MIDTANTVTERTFSDVLLCLEGCFLIYFDAKDFGFTVSLSSHQCNKSCACANIEDAMPFDTSPCSQQNAVRANLHGAAVVTNAELLKAEKVVTHCLGSEGYFIIRMQIYKKIRD